MIQDLIIVFGVIIFIYFQMDLRAYIYIQFNSLLHLKISN